MTYNNATRIPTDGLVLDIPLDGGVDARVGDDGSASNMVWVPSDRGYTSEVGSFNGSSSYITASASDYNNSNSFSLSTSITYNNSSSVANSRWYSKTDGSLNGVLLTVVSGQASFWLYDGAWKQATFPTALVDGQTYQINCVYDSIANTSDIFVDAVQGTQVTGIGTVTNGNSTHYLGRYGANYFDGEIGLFKVYDKVLSQDEINTLYNEGLRRLGPTAINYSTPTDGLVLSYDSEHLALDTSGNGNDGTVSNVTKRTVGTQVVGEYNGSSSWIQTPDLISGTTAFSISAIVKFNSVSGIEPITANWASGTNQHLLRNNAGTLQFYIETNINQYQLTSGSLVAGKTYNITATYNGSIIKTYIDGVEVGSLAASGTVKNGTALDGFGRYNSTYIDGTIGLPRIYDKALSQTEITTLYQEGLTKLSFPKYSTSSLEEGKVMEISRPQSGGVYVDQSGNGNNGTPTSVTDSTLGLNNVMSFNGSSKVDLGNVLNEDGSTPFTWACNYKTTAATTQTLISKSSASPNYNGPLLRLYSTGLPLANLTNSPSNEIQIQYDDVITNDGEWHRIVLRYDGSKTAAGTDIFIDGVHQGTKTIGDDTLSSLSFGNTTTSFQIGARDNGTNFTGDILNVETWGKFLSSEEILDDFYKNYIPN